MRTDPIQRAIDRVLPDTTQPPPSDRIWAKVAVSLGGETGAVGDTVALGSRRGSRLLMLTAMAVVVVAFTIVGYAPFETASHPANDQRAAIFTAVEHATAVDSRLIDWLRRERAVLWQASEPAVIALDATIDDLSAKLLSDRDSAGGSLLEAQLLRYVTWRSALLVDLAAGSAG